MFHAWQHFSFGSAVARKFIGDEDTRHVGAALEELAEELLGCCFVSSALDQDIQDVPVLINRTPQVLALPLDLQENFVE